MMLLLLLYINVSLMLIHESTQLKGLQRRLRRTRTAKLNIQEKEVALKSYLKNQNRSVDEFISCVQINLRSNRGKNFTEAISQFMKIKTVLGTSLGLLRKFIIEYYDNNFEYNKWLFIHEALKNIVEEHENSGEFRCTLRWPTFHIEITTYYAFYHLHNVNKLNDTYNNRII
ncbi:hypothetical protein KSF78_0009074 [Schistosoma japonicum]|nr:hypothetical protein KSF78_0009074 [Schistosoma japonicum]